MALKFEPNYDHSDDMTWDEIDGSVEFYNDGSVVAVGHSVISGLTSEEQAYFSFDFAIASGMMTGVGS